MKPYIYHLGLALFLSYGLSLYFWFGLGTFNLIGFVFISVAVAFIGSLSGLVSKQTYWITALITIVLRLIVYGVMTSGV